MLQLKNNTPFTPGIALFPNEHGVDSLYVTVKATFDIQGSLTIADEQQPLIEADQYWGEPEQSSLKYASEYHLAKPYTDIILIGEACAHDKRPVKELDVSLSVGDYGKTVRVFGDRYWEKNMVGHGISSPQPFEVMPLVYERAFGGVHIVDPDTDEVVFEGRNPLGKGFVGKRTKKEIDGLVLPNLEAPANLISKPQDMPAPACFAPILPSWEPRKSFAGTYDEVWQHSRAPYLPSDFDSRFFNTAHPDLVCNGYLKGGEPAEVINASPEGPVRFVLPRCELNVKVWISGVTEQPPLNLETVLIEPSESRLIMFWRGVLECDKSGLKIEFVELELSRLQLTDKAA
ncbi:MAG TPA: DUF2169 domain-containing protein [Nitrospiraceae bacterium]|nr:DUF2169 domain-containing protein [Nitrospiraceae bacterium]